MLADHSPDRDSQNNHVTDARLHCHSCAMHPTRASLHFLRAMGRCCRWMRDVANAIVFHERNCLNLHMLPTV